MPKNGLPALHPGLFLLEILQELGLPQATLARRIGVSPMRISHVINGRRPVTAALALRFARAFGQTPEYWLNLQATYDLKIAAREWAKGLKKIATAVPTAMPMRLQKRGKGVVAVPSKDLPPLTAEQIREVVERVRR